MRKQKVFRVREGRRRDWTTASRCQKVDMEVKPARPHVCAASHQRQTDEDGYQRLSSTQQTGTTDHVCCDWPVTIQLVPQSYIFLRFARRAHRRLVLWTKRSSRSNDLVLTASLTRSPGYRTIHATTFVVTGTLSCAILRSSEEEIAESYRLLGSAIFKQLVSGFAWSLAVFPQRGSSEVDPDEDDEDSRGQRLPRAAHNQRHSRC